MRAKELLYSRLVFLIDVPQCGSNHAERKEGYEDDEDALHNWRVDTVVGKSSKYSWEQAKEYYEHYENEVKAHVPGR